MMFCGKCKAQIPDGAVYCKNCGARVETGQPGATASNAGSGSGAPAGLNQPNGGAAPGKKRRELPIGVILLLGLVAVVAASFLYMMIVNSGPSASSGAQQQAQQAKTADVTSGGNSQDSAKAAAPSDASASATSNAATSTSGTSNSATSTSVTSSASASAASNPKSDVSLSNVKINEDSGGRYYITGTISNKGDMEYGVTCSLSATKHAFDKNGKEETSVSNSFTLQSVTAGVGGHNNGKFIVHALQPGETRAFTLYTPDWKSSDITHSDPVATVEEVTLPASALTRLRILYDYAGNLAVSSITYHADDGTITGKLTNNTPYTLNEAYICFAALDANGQYAIYNTQSTRPSGVVETSAVVKQVSPGATVDFSVNIGKGYANVNLIDVAYKPSESKS